MLELRGKHTLTKKDVRAIRREIRRIMEAASLDNANLNKMDCGQPDETVTLNLKTDVTAFVQDALKIHHGSWVLRPLFDLSQALKDYE